MSTDWLSKARIEVVEKVLTYWVGDKDPAIQTAEGRHMLHSYSKRLDVAEAIVRELKAMDEVLALPLKGLHIELRGDDGYWLVMLDPERMYAAQSSFVRAHELYCEAWEHQRERGRRLMAEVVGDLDKVETPPV
jgi:hypothetical protein